MQGSFLLNTMKISFGKKSINVDVDEVSFFRRGIGLMFRTSKTKPLLFDLGSNGWWAITSLFVFFPFLALWLDEKNRVVEYRTVKPFEFSIKPKKEFRRLVEVPFNERNDKIIDFFVDKRKI